MMTGLLIFLLCALLLVVGYAAYGRVAERIYGVRKDRAMPCTTREDGVDYVRMPSWRVFLVQLLNIAGLGPVFGALAGCLYGPVALVWIVVGCIFVGAVHDFLAAVMSAEHDGANMPYLVGCYLGSSCRHALRLVCVGLLLMVGVVFDGSCGYAACAGGLYFCECVVHHHSAVLPVGDNPAHQHDYRQNLSDFRGVFPLHGGRFGYRTPLQRVPYVAGLGHHR